MSADNGIYVLQTPSSWTATGMEYRVAELQAAGNYQWDDAMRKYTSCERVQIKNAREMWARTPVFDDQTEALAYAHKLADQCDILEYGVNIIYIDKEFSIGGRPEFVSSFHRRMIKHYELALELNAKEPQTTLTDILYALGQMTNDLLVDTRMHELHPDAKINLAELTNSNDAHTKLVTHPIVVLLLQKAYSLAKPSIIGGNPLAQVNEALRKLKDG